MKIKLLLFTFFLISFQLAIAQTYEKPFVATVGDRICFITKVELTKQFTVISFEHYNNNGWIRLSKDIRLQTADGKKLHYVKSEDIALVPNQYAFSPEEEKHAFKVYFEPLPKGIHQFDVIEVEPGSKFDFNFYGVNLDKQRTSDEQIAHFETPNSTETTTVISSPPPSFMPNFGEMYKDIYKSSMETFMNYMKQPGKLKEIAQLNKTYYDELINQGFNKDQALQILISSSFIPHSLGNN